MSYKRPSILVQASMPPEFVAEIDRLALDLGLPRSLMLRRVLSAGLASLTGASNSYGLPALTRSRTPEGLPQ